MPPSQPLSSTLAIAALGALAVAQCDPIVQPGLGVPGVVGTVETTLVWDPDGPGPLGEHLVLGGNFSLAGTVVANGIALFDPASGQWTALGNLSGQVSALAAMTNGDLVAAGSSMRIGQSNTNNIARWNGSTWSGLGSGCTSPPISSPSVQSLAVRPNGDLIASGPFTLAGGVSVPGIARWDGTAWHSMGPLGMQPLLPGIGPVAALPNGDVLAGLLTTVGGVPVGHIARWDGASWSTLGSGMTSASGGFLPWIPSIEVLTNGDVVAAGQFGFAGGQPANNIARWDGFAWSPLGPGLGSTTALRALPNGHLLAGGLQVLGTHSVARWDGISWSGVGTLPTTAQSLAALSNGSLFAAGDFRPEGNFGGRGIARWNGTSWKEVASGTDGAIEKVLALGNGRFLALGDVRSVGGAVVTRAAWFDGQMWQAAGEPIAGTLQAASTFTDGRAVIAVRTSPLWAYPPQCTLQQWDGTSWTTIGHCSSEVTAMATAPNGDIHVACSSGSIWPATAGLAVWNGTTWSAGAPTTGIISALLFRRDGQLVASGSSLPNWVAQWNGSQWAPMGSGLQQPATGLAERWNGDVVAIGNWATVNGAPCLDIALWDGAAWQPLGTGLGNSANPDRVTSVATLPNGDVLAAGGFDTASGVPVHNIARWDGSAWHDVGGGADGFVSSMVTTPTGTIVLGGSFLTVDGLLSAGVARVEPTCPGLEVRYGTSCFGLPDSLRIDELAFVGGALRSHVEGVAPGSLVLAVVGLAPTQVPLPSLLPQGAPGCALLATPDVVALASTTANPVQATFAIPRVTALVGAVLYHQALPIATSANGGFAVRSTNGRVLVVGSMW